MKIFHGWLEDSIALLFFLIIAKLAILAAAWMATEPMVR